MIDFYDKKLGTWITLCSTELAEIVGRSGFDWVVVDMEHSMLSVRQVGEIVRIIELLNVPPIVRLPSIDIPLAKRVLDAGASGLLFPQINCKAEAELAASAMRYMPHGRRGVGLGRAQGYGNSFDEYFKWSETGLSLILQIETASGIENIESILSVDGVTAIIIGPYDLTCSLGIPGEFESSKFQRAKEKLVHAAKNKNIPVGLHVVEPDKGGVVKAFETGFDFIAYGVDFRIFDQGLREGLNFCRDVSTK